MRQWMVDPEIMCRQHLLGEHVEHHMFVGTINKGVSLAGYLADNLMEPAALQSRHAELAAEMEARGYNHRSPLQHQIRELSAEEMEVMVNKEPALLELLRRCPDCKARYLKKYLEELK